MGDLLLDDVFKVAAVDPDGKKFDRVSRIKAHGDNYGISMLLDVNTDLYPMRLNDKFSMALTKSISLDPSSTVPSDSLADKYEYVMYGRVFKFEDTPANKMAVYVSFGGLLMRLEAEPRHLQGVLAVGANLYLLVRRI